MTIPNHIQPTCPFQYPPFFGNYQRNDQYYSWPSRICICFHMFLYTSPIPMHSFCLGISLFAFPVQLAKLDFQILKALWNIFHSFGPNTYWQKKLIMGNQGLDFRYHTFYFVICYTLFIPGTCELVRATRKSSVPAMEMAIMPKAARLMTFLCCGAKRGAAMILLRFFLSQNELKKLMAMVMSRNKCHKTWLFHFQRLTGFSNLTESTFPEQSCKHLASFLSFQN